MAFADNLRRVMEMRNITAAQLGPRVGVTPTAVRMWLAGKTGPVERRLAAVATALGVPVAELFATRPGVAEEMPAFQSDGAPSELDRLPEVMEALTRALADAELNLGPRRTTKYAQEALELASSMARRLAFEERARMAVEAKVADIRRSLD